MTIMLHAQRFITVAPADISPEWLEKHSSSASLIFLLMPFNGIAFLWFTGVLRDWLIDWEDRFFSTVFMGSAILFVAMLFVWAASFGALLGTFGVAKEKMVDSSILVFGYVFMKEILGDYALRMMGVYMSSIATIWTRTALMPRWITIITYIIATACLFFARPISETRFVFPLWVLLVSVYILFSNYRRPR